MARIVSLGNCSQNIYLSDRDDLFFAVPTGTKLDIDQISYAVGGGGLNAAVSFARYGHETILIGDLANDSAGEAILATLDEEGIDNSYISRNHTTTDTSIILLNSANAERTILNCRGIKKFAPFDENDLDLIQPHWLYVSTLNGDMNVLRRFFEKAKENNIKVMFNPGPAELAEPQKVLGLLEDIDILLVDKADAANLVPGTILTELLSRLHNYVKTIIITAGPMGGIATNDTETYRFGIYEDVPVKDATGVGDAFGAGFLSSFAANHDFKRSLIFASANSTAVIQKIGYNCLNGRAKLHEMPIQQL